MARKKPSWPEGGVAEGKKPRAGQGSPGKPCAGKGTTILRHVPNLEGFYLGNTSATCNIVPLEMQSPVQPLSPRGDREKKRKEEMTYIHRERGGGRETESERV